jgi:hypothetical protein
VGTRQKARPAAPGRRTRTVAAARPAPVVTSGDT